MNDSTIRRLILAVVFATVSATTANSSAAAKAETPRAVLDQSSQDFGTVAQGFLVRKSFTIANEGSALLIISGMKISARGMTVRVKPEILPGETATVRVEWDTRQQSHDVEGRALLLVNDPENPRVALVLSGTVVPALDILPSPLVFFSVFQGDGAERVLSFVNNQSDPIQVTGLEREGTHFEAAHTVLEPGYRYEIRITVPPELETGRFREALYIVTDDPSRPRLRAEVNVLVKPDLFVTPEAVEFGLVDLSQLRSSPSAVELTHQALLIKRRDGEMEITSVASDLDFLKLSLQSSSRAQVFQLNVGLDEGRLSPGAFRGAISIETDDLAHPKILIPVTGEFR
jgi:hypothetical protein